MIAFCLGRPLSATGYCSDAGALLQEHAEVLLKAVSVALQFVFNFTTACTAAQELVWCTQFPDGLMQTVQVCFTVNLDDA
jgi:hypothetical protein